MKQTTDHGWTVSARGYKSAIDMGAPSCAEVIGPDHAANARLMAAAPDLLAALRGVDEFCQQGLNSPRAEHWEAALDDIMGLVRAAITKTTGA